MSDLALPGAITETGLDLPADLTFEEWEATGQTLGRIGRACQWWIGDWLNYGERAYGEKYAQAMEATGLDYATVADYAYVARHIESSVRTENLSWSHHKVVAALEPPDQDVYLKKAAENGWSVSELRKQIKNEEQVEQPDRCPTCGQRIPKGGVPERKATP